MKKELKIVLTSAVAAVSILISSNSKSNDNVTNEEPKIDESQIPYEEVVLNTPEVTIEPTPEVIRQFDLAYLTNNTKVFDEEMNLIDNIDIYQKVVVIEEYGNIKKIEYSLNNETAKEGYVFSECLEYLPDTFVEVDLSDQVVRMYIDNEMVLEGLVVTGDAYKSPTDLGYFEIYWKEQNTVLRGYNSDGSLKYAKFVNYWMPFNGGQGLHDAEEIVDEDGTAHGWRKKEDFGGETYIGNGSGGCVNELNADAKFVYEHSEVGTKV